MCALRCLCARLSSFASCSYRFAPTRYTSFAVAVALKIRQVASLPISNLDCNVALVCVGQAVVFLDRDDFKSTWLGNKSIYRTRMAIADGGELIVMAPGVTKFGEDPAIDSLIRRVCVRCSCLSWSSGTNPGTSLYFSFVGALLVVGICRYVACAALK